ncbi:hypothetical protein F5B21DRAFT_63272 [Xylaria acuta]|nr:hypothetical protein F5B21DRAFT_63272 [Xylaria acuta]
MPFNSGSTPSDSTFRGSIAARSSPPFSHSSPASSDGLLPTGGIAFSFDSRSPSAQTLTGGILPGGSSSDAARRRESSQQDGGPSNIFGASRSGSGRTPLFGQPPSQDGSPSNIFPANSSSTRRAPLFAESSSNPGTPFSFPCLSPAHPSVQGNALFGASSANARQSRESSPQSRGTSNIFSSASPSSGGAALFGQSPSRAESIFSFQYLSPRVQSPDNNALFGGTFRNANPSQVTTPQNDSSPSLFAQPSRQSSISRVLSPQNSSAANTPSTHTSGAPLFGPGSASAGSSRGLRFHGGPSNIFGPQSNTSSPLPSPSRPASSSTTSDGGGVLTPRSDSRSLFSASASNLNLNASPGPASRSPSVDQHHVQPSIEQQDDAPGTPASFRNRRRTTRSSTSQTLSAHGQIPSVSLSPPVQGRGSRLNDMGSVDRDLAQLRLSTSTATPRRSNTSTNTETGMGMGAIAAALNNLDYDRSASGLLTPSPGSRYPLNDDNALLTPRPSPRRRRSSSAAAPPHNIRDETPPNDRFNAAPFQNALSGARTLMGELANVLGSGALHREPKSVISQSYAQAQRLNGFECSSRRTVVLVGDSGTGESYFCFILFHHCLLYAWVWDEARECESCRATTRGDQYELNS